MTKQETNSAMNATTVRKMLKNWRFSSIWLWFSSVISAPVRTSVSLSGPRLSWMRDARSAVELWSTAGKRLHAVKLPELGSAGGLSGRAADPEVFFTFTGFARPASVERLDAATGKRTTFRAPKVAFDPSRFETRQVFYASRDGTRVPMFVVHRKGLARDGKAPTLLYGYGGFNIDISPWYSPVHTAWLEAGGALAFPNIRGGGEYGRSRADNRRPDCAGENA